MNIARKIALLVAVAASIAALPDSAARAAGSGSSSMPSSMPAPRDRSSAELAKSAYNSGVKQLRKAESYEKDAAKATNPEKQQKARSKAAGAYEKALEQFQTAVSHVPGLYEAWNYIGFTQRKLGRYDSALLSYEQALKLNPGFPEAIEYRGEAYLGLNRVDDARQAYMDLFASSGELAAQLLTAMQEFVSQRRQEPNGLDAQALESFAQWVDERATIAQQTASLDSGSHVATWR
jgi:tetratricopeptide (TPR) repeat protein